MALESQFGSFFDSYDSVVRMLHTLKEINLGTYVDIQDSWFAEDSSVKVLERVFSHSTYASKHSDTVNRCYVWMEHF
jgi:hypothetical protein